MFTIVPSDAARIVNPRHCRPVGPAQWSSTPVGAGGGALVEVACVVLAVEEGGGDPGDVRVHTWYLSGPHYHHIDISFERTGKKRKGEDDRTRTVPGAQPPNPQPPPLYETQFAPPYSARWLSPFPVKTQFCCATPG
jgi:hypothetical protein